MANSKKRYIPRPQIPDGSYVVSYCHHWLYKGQFGRKLYVEFEVAEGQYKGERVVRIFNVMKASGNRSFKVSRSGALWAEFCAVMDGHLDTRAIRLDELPIKLMGGIPIEARIRMVTENTDGVPLRGGSAYSVVANLYGRASQSGNAKIAAVAELVQRALSSTPSLELQLKLKPKPKPAPTPEPTPISDLHDVDATTDTAASLGMELTSSVLSRDQHSVKNSSAAISGKPTQDEIDSVVVKIASSADIRDPAKIQLLAHSFNFSLKQIEQALVRLGL